MRRWDDSNQLSKYGFRDGFSTDIDLRSTNEIGKCRDEIWFYIEFVK